MFALLNIADQRAKHKKVKYRRKQNDEQDGIKNHHKPIRQRQEKDNGHHHHFAEKYGQRDDDDQTDIVSGWAGFAEIADLLKLSVSLTALTPQFGRKWKI
jgi:hypothetical protein